MNSNLNWPANLTKHAEFSAVAPKARILVAEDDDAMRVFLENALSRAGHEVCALANGDAAASRAEAAEYDLLVTDVKMPGLDGVDLARQVLARSPNLGIIFVTGFAAKALQATDIIGHGARVLSKPFKLSELVGQVERIVAQTRDSGKPA